MGSGKSYFNASQIVDCEEEDYHTVTTWMILQ